MITLTLLHPNNTTPLQNWSFDDESVISVGRGTDNQVVLYSAVVSRRHLQISREGDTWELKNLGANGTYIDGKLISSIPVSDGMIVRLASSGPQIQIKLIVDENPPRLSIERLDTGEEYPEQHDEKDTITS